MDNEQAKFLLSAARASGADASDPQIAEALAQARREPALARWLEQERAFDTAVVRKLQHREPPASLRAQIVAGARASRPPGGSTTRRDWRGLAVAAAAVIALGAAGLWWWWHDDSRSSGGIVITRAPLVEWQESCLAIFADPNFALDLMSGEYPPVERFLLDHGTPVLPAIPLTSGTVDLLGCKALTWRDQPVSFLCFKAHTGELVHLFVVPRGTAEETPLVRGALRTAVGEFSTVTWIEGDLIAMVASRMPAPRLDALVTRATASHGTTAVLVARR